MIDFQKTALVLIDLQKGILQMPTVPHTTGTITQNAKKMIDLWRSNDGFIAMVRVKFHDGKDILNPIGSKSLPGDPFAIGFSDFADELTVLPTDYIVNKRHFSAFFGTDLDLQLRCRGIDTIVLGGISTHAGVDSTARDAYQLGYHQYFIEDMMGAATTELHAFPLNTLFPLMGEILTTNDFIKIINKKGERNV